MFDFPCGFPGAKFSFKNLVPLQKGMSSGTEPSGLKLEFGKAKTLRTWHAVSWWWWWWNLIRRILGVLKIPEKPTGFLDVVGFRKSSGGPLEHLTSTCFNKKKRKYTIEILHIPVSKLNQYIIYMYHILDVVLKSFTFQVLSKLCWKNWGKNTSTYS